MALEMFIVRSLKMGIPSAMLFGGIMNSFKTLTKKEWLLWSISEAVVIASNIISGKIDIVNLMATVIGVTALIFVAKGDVLGQVLTLIFSALYAIASWRFHYWGEMITYLGMSAPSAAAAIVSWLKNPYEKGKNVVKIHRLKAWETALMIVLTIAVTTVFYFILGYLKTPNLWVSTVSVTTSFLASYLLFFRNSYYALAYAANDIVLIILWILATISDISYLPMIFCFVMFLLNDLYGFISWKKREGEQGI